LSLSAIRSALVIRKALGKDVGWRVDWSGLPTDNKAKALPVLAFAGKTTTFAVCSEAAPVRESSPEFLFSEPESSMPPLFSIGFSQIIFAETTLTPMLLAQAAGRNPQPGPLELMIQYLPMVLIVVVAWVLLYKPERERMRQQKELLLSLKKNDRVVTTSGIYGTVANVEREADRVLLKVDDSGNVKITVTLSSIAKVVGDASEAAPTSA